jgi:hypothetical protein
MSFWLTLEHLEISASSSGLYPAMEFTTDTNAAGDCGLARCKDIRVLRNGILFKSTYGPSGVNNIIIEDLISEGQLDGTSLVEFDSTAHNVAQIKITRLEVADALGTAYLMKNTGKLTGGIVLDMKNEPGLPYKPGSDPINGLVMDNTLPSSSVGGLASLSQFYAGTTVAER